MDLHASTPKGVGGFNRFAQTARPCCSAVVSGCLDGRQRQTDRQTDSNSTSKSTPNRPPNRHQIDPKSTQNRPSWLLAPARRARREHKHVYSMVALRFCRFGPIWGRCCAPLDFDLGPKIVQQCLRRDFFGLLRSPRALFVHFQVNIKSKTTFDRC